MMYFLPILLMVPLQQDPPSDDWVVVKPPRIGASVRMPSIPRWSERKMRPIRDREEITVRSRSVLIDGGKGNLTFVYHDEPERPTNRKSINALLDGAVIGAIALVNGELIQQNEIFEGKHKGRDFLYTCEIDDAKLQQVHKLRIRSKIVLIRQRLFSLNYISEADVYDKELVQKFFDSFEVINEPKDLPPTPRLGREEQLKAERETQGRPPATPETSANLSNIHIGMVPNSVIRPTGIENETHNS